MYAGITYDLSHLHPTLITYLQTAKEGKPERAYKVQIIFSLHCFTSGKIKGEQYASSLYYKDNIETRIFDFKRYALSKGLPEIMRNLMQKQCYHTEKGNFFALELVDNKGNKKNYEIYFIVFLSAENRLTLRVQSAYIRDEHHLGSQPKRQKINFGVILSNTQARKPIKPPK